MKVIKKILLSLVVLVLITSLIGCVGENGIDGNSITEVVVNDQGELVVSFSDGKIKNLGKISGEDGENGLGVSSFTLNEEGELFVTYSDDSTKNLGKIIGSNGTNGIDGTNGKEVLLQVKDGYIQWKYVGDTSWSNLIDLTLLTGSKGQDGKDGRDGREVLLQITETHIQWKYVGDTSWSNLLDLTLLSGSDGQDGVDGINGEDGIDGKEVLFQITETYIQWKYQGDSAWEDLISIEQLKGQTGEDGLTPYIGGNGNWFIGEVDTGMPSLIIVDNMDRIGTDGLYFDLTIKNGIAGYEVTSYSGVATDIIIPNEIFGQKVISIRQDALPKTITSLSISKYTEILPNFRDYTNLKSFDFNGASVTTIPNDGFRAARNLEEITNYSNIETIGTYAFYDTKILFNDFDFSNIINIGTYAFYINSMSDYDVEGIIVKEINGAIAVSDQTFIYLPETVQTIGYRAFPLEFSIYYGGNESVEFTSEFFFKNVKQTEEGYWYVDRNTYVGLLNYTGDLIEIDVPDKLDGKNVTVVENYAFIGDNRLSRINLPNSITSIGNYAFVYTRELYVLHIPTSIVNISNSYFAQWIGYEESSYGMIFPAPVIVFENNQADMNLGSNSVSNYEWGRYAFGYSKEEIVQDNNFVYLEKPLSYEIIAIKNATGKVIIPSIYNFKPIIRINQFSLLGYNGGISFVEISDGVEFISTHAFYASRALRYVNIPSSVSAVNYQGFYDLRNLEIHVKASEKPSNWDSSWYSSIKNVVWNSEFNGVVSADGLYLYSIIGGNARIDKYFGTWNGNNALFIPETIDGYTVTSISSNAIQYTSSVNYLKIVIPNTVLTIDSQAIYYYQYLRVYSNLTERPNGWNTTFGYNYWNSSNSETYRSYYWQGQWSLVNGEPS